MTRHELIHALEAAGIDESKLAERFIREANPEHAGRCRARMQRFYRLAERLENGESVE
jgi:hypothetical protein